MNLHVRFTLRPLRDLALRLRLDPSTRTPSADEPAELRAERSSSTLDALRRPGAVAATLFFAWYAVAPWLPTEPIPAPMVPWVSQPTAVPELPQPWPQSIALDAAKVVEERFARGSTFAGELRQAGVSGATAAAVVDAARATINLRRIRDGQSYRLYFDGADELLGVRYPVDRQTAYFMALEDGAWVTRKVVLPIETRAAFVSATIASSLHAALRPRARPQRAVNQLISEITSVFGWDVDFNYELQPGDRLDLMIEERFVEDEFIGYGDLLAAEFRVGGRTLTAVRYADESGATSYFAPDGASLRRTFLRSPVKYSRISSRFTNRRVHPVTGIARAHRGVDYVADPGTPVQATADGVVAEAGYGAERGRYIKIRHGGSFASYYLHLSRIHENVARGTELQQGDIIGYVGKTGSATGYHLHYSVTRAGSYVDPLEVDVPSADPVPLADFAAFREQRDRWLTQLRASQLAPTVRTAGGAGGA